MSEDQLTYRDDHFNYVIVGDGKHDDTEAIQAHLDGEQVSWPIDRGQESFTCLITRPLVVGKIDHGKIEDQSTYKSDLKPEQASMTDCYKCDGPAPSKTICDACEESRTDQLVSDVYEVMGNPVFPPHTCLRCDLPMMNGVDVCPCCGMPRPDPAREAEIDRRIHAMKRIHELEMSMTGLQRREWIEHGQYILNRDRGESVGFGLGEK